MSAIFTDRFMIPRALQASKGGIQQAAIAFISTGLTQDEFARQLNLSRSTLTNFLAGKPVYRANFFKICKTLRLNPEEILKPTGELLNYLSKNRQNEFEYQFVNIETTPVELSQWFQNIYEEEWQSIESVFDLKEENLAYIFRSAVHKEMRRAKLINLGVQLVGLLIALIPEADHKMRIRVQVHPADGEAYLQPNLRLVLLSSSGAILQEVQSRSQDNYIQLKRFQCPTGTCFSIQVALDDVSLMEDFVI